SPNGGSGAVRFLKFAATRRTALGVLAAVLIVTASWLAGCSSSRPAAQHTPLQVQVGDGWLQGTMSQGAREFLGVPYAAPPARFAAPQPARPWNGVRSATAHGPA